MNYQELLKSIVNKTQNKSYLAEVFLAKNTTYKVEALNQKIEAIETINDVGISLRVIKDHKLGFSYTSELDEDGINELIDKAIHNSSQNVKDEYNDFYKNPTPLKFNPDNYFDNNIAKISPTERINFAKAIEAAAYKASSSIKRTEKVAYSDSESEIYLTNSYGINVNCKTNAVGAWIQVLSESNNEWETGYGIQFCTKLSDFKPNKIGDEAAQEAESLLNGKSVPTQKLSIVLTPKVGCQLLSAISSLFSAEAVQKNKSLLAGLIDHSIASTNITIIDDGTLKNELNSAPFDLEGCPTQANLLIENGKLKKYLHNTYTALKDKTINTGNASRSSYLSPPIISPSNFYIQPSSVKAENIVNHVSKGILIKRLMGLHTINPISGEFSLGIAGILIENGKLTQPVRGITISGNIIELLKDIKAVGNDLRFMLSSANFGSPTLLIEGISIGGH